MFGSKGNSSRCSTYSNGSKGSLERSILGFPNASTSGVAFAMVVVPRHRWWSGVLLAVAATAASGFDFLREESGGSPNAWVRAILGFVLFVGVTLAVSFDTLAVLSALGRWVRRLHRGS